MSTFKPGKNISFRAVGDDVYIDSTIPASVMRIEDYDPNGDRSVEGVSFTALVNVPEGFPPAPHSNHQITDVVGLQEILDNLSAGVGEGGGGGGPVGEIDVTDLPEEVVQQGDLVNRLVVPPDVPEGYFLAHDGEQGIIFVQPPAGGEGGISDGFLLPKVVVGSTRTRHTPITVSDSAVAGILPIDVDASDNYKITLNADVSIDPEGEAPPGEQISADLILVGSGEPHTVTWTGEVYGEDSVTLNDGDILLVQIRVVDGLPHPMILIGDTYPAPTAEKLLLEGSLGLYFFEDAIETTFAYNPGEMGARAGDTLVVICGRNATWSTSDPPADITSGDGKLTAMGSAAGNFGACGKMFYRTLGSGDLEEETYNLLFWDGGQRLVVGETGAREPESGSVMVFLVRNLSSSPMENYSKDESVSDRNGLVGGDVVVPENSVIINAYVVNSPALGTVTDNDVPTFQNQEGFTDTYTKVHMYVNVGTYAEGGTRTLPDIALDRADNVQRITGILK